MMTRADVSITHPDDDDAVGCDVDEHEEHGTRPVALRPAVGFSVSMASVAFRAASWGRGRGVRAERTGEPRGSATPLSVAAAEAFTRRMRTMGVEEELLLIDRATGVPAPVATELMAHARAAGSSVDGPVVGEMHQEMLEVITRPHAELADLGREVLDNRAYATELAAASGALAAPLATSPLPVTPHPTRSDRYDRLMDRYGAMPRRNLTCGLHVHVAVASDDEGVGVLDRIRTWTPVLVALSANSPFHDGVDTGHASYRSLAWNQWPSAGPAEPYGSVESYRAVTSAMLDTGTLLDGGMLYLDARLSQHHPTVEVRVADVPLDPDVTVTIAGLVRALVDTAAIDHHARREPARTPACAIRLANWRAALEGTSGDLVHPLTGRPAPAGEVVMALLDHVMPALRANGDDHLVERGLAELFAVGTGADHQRGILAATGDLSHVARSAGTMSERARTDRRRPTAAAGVPVSSRSRAQLSVGVG